MTKRNKLPYIVLCTKYLYTASNKPWLKLTQNLKQTYHDKLGFQSKTTQISDECLGQYPALDIGAETTN